MLQKFSFPRLGFRIFTCRWSTRRVDPWCRVDRSASIRQLPREWTKRRDPFFPQKMWDSREFKRVYILSGGEKKYCNLDLQQKTCKIQGSVLMPWWLVTCMISHPPLPNIVSFSIGKTNQLHAVNSSHPVDEIWLPFKMSSSFHNFFLEQILLWGWTYNNKAWWTSTQNIN